MPDLRDWYDRSAVASHITQPGFGELERRARHRVRRQWATGAAALVALVTVPVLSLPGGGDRPAPPVQTPTASPSPPPTVPRALRDPDESPTVNVRFLDIRHGYATYQARPWHECATWLSYTADGGRSWSELRELPGSYHDPSEEDAGGCWGPLVDLIAPEVLVVRHPEGDTAYLSRDAGLTWRAYRPQERTADAVPTGVVATLGCPEPPYDGDCDRLVLRWYDPGSGDELVLAVDPPALSGYDVDAMTWGDDGSLWLDGTAEDDFRVLVSRDQGRSWQAHTVAGRITPRRDPAVYHESGMGTAFATQDGVTGYLAAFEDDDDGWQARLFRTTDGGASWHPLPGRPQVTGWVSLWVARDGTLVMVDDTGASLSHDRGESFQPEAGLPVAGADRVPGGYTSMSSGEPFDRFYGGVDHLSEDGLTWRLVEPPRV